MLQNEKPRRGMLINFIQKVKKRKKFLPFFVHFFLLATKKGLVYTEIETHIKPDGGEVNCRVPFSITTEHVCKEERASISIAAGAVASAGTAQAAAGSDGAYQVLDVEVSKLVSHSGEVFACQWNPKHPNILATGASDATAVLWSIPRGKSCAAAGKAASDNKKVSTWFS
jgi:hypothetical protein